jgi:hypothetical protein
MNVAAATGIENRNQTKLSRRDWILLPLISLLTVAILGISTECALRLLFPASKAGFENCFVPVQNDLPGNAPAKPNSVCFERIAESKFPVEYRFDSRGHRSGVELKPKEPDSYRIVMIGSSMAMGLYVPQEMSFAAMLPKELSQRTGRKVELYNEATGGKYRGGPYPIAGSVHQFNEVLSADPDMILWVVTPADIENADSVNDSSATNGAMSDSAPVEEPYGSTSAWSKLRNLIAGGSLGDKLRDQWEQSRTAVMLKHFLLANESPYEYVRSYLENENEAGFLRAQPNSKWQHLLSVFQNDAAEFAQEARNAGVPFVVVLIPNRAQAAMLSMGEWPQGYDPYKLDHELHDLIQANGGTYIDVLPEFRRITSPERYYFPVDGHLDPGGHAVVSGLLTHGLTGGAVSALKAAPQAQIASAQGR